MPELRPFQGLTPAAGRAAEVASPPYDVLSADEAAAICRRSPDSFMHVVRPDALLPEADAHGPRAYERAAAELQRLRDAGALARSAQPVLYAYRLTWRGRSQTGVVGLASVADYDRGVVRKHEHTRPDKELDRADHIEHLGAQCGPVFLICPSTDGLRGWLSATTAGSALHDFEVDGVRHTVWEVSDAAAIARAQAEFAGMEATYVADGHHRSAAASMVCRRRADAGLPTDAASGFLTVTFPDDEVEILPYNRAVRDLHGQTAAELLERVAGPFDLRPLGGDSPGPDRPGCFDMYIDGGWWRLTAREEITTDDAVSGLDVALLQDHLLAPLLGVGEPRTDERIAFVGGIRGATELERLVDSGEHAVAFALHPTPVAALLAVADSGRVMPPKSTWFEPKLRSGLFVHLL